jgi:cytoskeletal protein RodZ
VSIGESLAEGRRQAGLTITQVSQRTRIRESIVRAIEQGDFSACGGDFYARGHIRSIATAIGMDPAPLIHDYDETHEPPGSISAAEVFEPSKPIKISEPRSFGLGKVMIGALLIVIGFGVYHLVSTSGSHHNPQAGAFAAAADQATATATPTPKPSATPPKVRTVAVTTTADLSITATENCWVEITKANGSLVYNDTIQAGSSMRWSERQKVFVQLGNPGGIVLRVNGKRADLNSSMPIVLTVAPGKGVKVLGPSGTVQVPVAAAG